MVYEPEVDRTTRPDFVVNFDRPAHTAVKNVKGHWYLYECTYEYNPEKRRTVTKWGRYLGSIDEEGFHARQDCGEGAGSASGPCALAADLELGASRWCFEATGAMRGRLEKHFGRMWRQVYVTAVLEAISNDRLHRLGMRYRESVLSLLLPKVAMSRNSLSLMVKELGTMRKEMEAYMKEDVRDSSRFLLVDGHRVLTAAVDNPDARVGHDSKNRWRPQVNLLYMFELDDSPFGAPVYYEQFSGDRPDLSAVPEMLAGLGALPDNCIYVGDKGCSSARIVGDAVAAGLGYCVPLKRDNRFTKSLHPASEEYDTAFTYHNRAIQAKCLPQGDFNVFLFYDIELRADELLSITRRCEKANAKRAASRVAAERRLAAAEAKLEVAAGRLEADPENGEAAALVAELGERKLKLGERVAELQPVDICARIKAKPHMGTIVLRTNRTRLTAREVFLIYKKREAIEDFFKLYSVTLGNTGSYARNEQLMESWLFLNHLSARIASAALGMIGRHGMRRYISWDDFRRAMATIRVVRQNNSWAVPPVDPEVLRLCARLEIDPFDLGVLDNLSPTTAH